MYTFVATFHIIVHEILSINHLYGPKLTLERFKLD